MKVLKYPDPHLFKPCKEVTVFDSNLSELFDAMYETMIAEHGMGLAANQVGLSFRMFVMEGPSQQRYYFANPKITKRSLGKANLKEGCLSAPGEYLTLSERSSWVEVEYQNELGTKLKNVFHEIFAVCVQHEIDHLDGKSHLQSKSLTKQSRIALAKKWGFKLK